MILLKIFTILFFAVIINSTHGKPGFGPGDQEWGYVTVRPKAHMFWWLYYTTAEVKTGYEEKPLVIWIQGGPGVSGVGYGNFEELGPLNSKLQPRNHTWVKDYNVVFIDNPVGTGFSYVESRNLYCKDNKQIAKDLLFFIREFYAKFPKFSKTPTYILAESYGGKMTVEFAYKWYMEQKSGTLKTNLRGIGLVDSFISSNDMYKSLAPYLYNLGMIDRIGYDKLDKLADHFITINKSGDWAKAFQITNEIEFLMQNLTYHVDRLNILKRVKPIYGRRKILKLIHQREIHDDDDDNDDTAADDDDDDGALYSKALKNTMKLVTQTLGLKSNWSSQEGYVYRALTVDSRQPVVHYVEKLLNETDIKVFVFNGQLDLIINTADGKTFKGTLGWIEKLNWKYAKDWASATRRPLVVNNIIEGYYKGYGKFKFYWVNRSGHMIPAENPVAMEPILEDLIYN